MKFFVFFTILWVSAVSFSLTDAKGTNQQAEVNMSCSHKYRQSNLDVDLFYRYAIRDEEGNHSRI